MTHPLLTAFPRRDGDRLVFPGPDEEVVVEGDAELLLATLERCDGTRPLSEVLETVPGTARGAVADALAVLEERTLIVDRSHAFLRWHRDAAYPHALNAPDLGRQPPPAWRPALDAAAPSVEEDAGRRRGTGLRALLDARRSAPAQAFAGGPEAATLLALAAVADGAAGDRRTVPSAGALYPLVVHVACRQLGDGLREGLWWHDAERRALRLVPCRSGADVWAAFGLIAETRSLLAHAGALLVIAADLERTSAVYGNRAYRFACMEAGAAMQNVGLAAAELGVPSRALGGFDDHALAQALGLPPHVLPLLGIACG